MRARLLRLLLVSGVASLSCGGATTFHPVTEGEVVRYLGGSAPPPDGWIAPAFDDSGWASGPTYVGFGNSVATQVAGLGSDFPTLYVRARFDLGPLAAGVTRLRATPPVMGGGYVAWVNGVEVARVGIPSGADNSAFATEKASYHDVVLEVPAGTLLATGNVLAIEAHCVQNAHDLMVGFTVDADAPSAPTGIVRGPYLQALQTDGVTVVFDTAEAVPGRVVIDGQTFNDLAAKHHQIRVTGLAPSHHYTYYAAAGDRTSEKLPLTTAPGRGEPVRFLVYGDTRTNGDDQRRVVAAMAAEGIDVAIHTGDMTATGGDDSEWETFFTIEYPLMARTALYPAVGNHELYGSGGVDSMRRAFVLPADSPSPERLYGFDVGDVHLVAVDSNLPLDAQADWIEGDVAAARARGARHVFFYIHQGPYSAGTGHGGSEEARQFLAPLARRLGIDAIFGGHDHIYERGVADGLRYFVSGGGGAPFHDVDPLPSTQHAEARLHYLVVEVNGRHVSVQAKDPDGQVFDSVEW